MLGLGYLDCRLMVLGTKLFMAKTKIASDLGYAAHLSAVQADKAATAVKRTTETIKNKVSKKKVETVEANAEVVVENENVTMMLPEGSVVEVNGMEIPVAETPIVTNYSGPDFSLLQGVTYDPESNDLKVEEVPKTVVDGAVVVADVVPVMVSGEEPIEREVTQEDIDIALAKMRSEEPKSSKTSKSKK